MKDILWIALRNLTRFKRRTLLTGSLIGLGVALVLVFGGLATAFKETMVGVITRSNLADLQVHPRGYVESIDNLPLNLFLGPAEWAAASKALEGSDKVAAFSPRIRFAGMLSNYAQTTGIRLTAVLPAPELETCPGLADRLSGVAAVAEFVRPGEIILPRVLFKGLGLKLGDEVVVIATNRDGAVNGAPLRIAGVIESLMGPGGKDGYIHQDDARGILRMEKAELSEIAVRVRRFKDLGAAKAGLAVALGIEPGAGVFELHTWDQLAPFAAIAKLIDVLVLMVRLILVSIVLISVMNIMMMSVYERTNEIGTLAALGTTPGKILLLFLAEGVVLGLGSAAAGAAVGVGTLWALSQGAAFTFNSVRIVVGSSLPWGEIMAALAMVALISVLASLQPAFKASRLEPVDALRHV